MPVVADDPSANHRKTRPSLRPGRGAVLVILLACAAMQELSAPDAHPDFGMVPEPDQPLLVESASATPARGNGH